MLRLFALDIDIMPGQYAFVCHLVSRRDRDEHIAHASGRKQRVPPVGISPDYFYSVGHHSIGDRLSLAGYPAGNGDLVIRRFTSAFRTLRTGQANRSERQGRD